MLVQQCATSSQAGPIEVSTQSTTPVMWPSDQSTLRGWKSRWMKQGSNGGGGVRSSSNASRHSPGSLAHAGTWNFASHAQDW